MLSYFYYLSVHLSGVLGSRSNIPRVGRARNDGGWMGFDDGPAPEQQQHKSRPDVYLFSMPINVFAEEYPVGAARSGRAKDFCVDVD